MHYIPSKAVRLTLLAVVSAVPPAHASDKTWRVSLDSADQEATADSHFPAVSATGRYIVFTSLAADLVADDTNNAWDIFLRDRGTNTTERVSLTYLGAEANGTSSDPSVSDDGRFVVFESQATDLIKTDANGVQDVFVRDRTLGTTTLVSVAIGQANGPSDSAHISGDGRYVVFQSDASNLVAGDNNSTTDVFLRDLQTNLTVVLSQYKGNLGNGLSRSVRISQDGCWATFASNATNFGSLDKNAVRDIFRCDLKTFDLTRITAGTGWESNGANNNPDVSSDGRFIVFDSQATNFGISDGNGAHDIYLYDRMGAFERLSVATAGETDGLSHSPRVSADGNQVCFTSYANNLVIGDVNGLWDVFLHDRTDGSTDLVSTGASGNGDSWSAAADISETGKFVAFHSASKNLVQADSNGSHDVFLRGPHFLFDLTARLYYPFDPFEFLIFQGYPPDDILVAVTGINGKPWFRVIDIGRFDAHGIYSLRGTVPPGLKGIQLDLQALVNAMGTFEWTNPVQMTFG